MNNVLKIISTADLHMNVLDPEYMYNKLMEEFVMRIQRIDFDVLTICGDIFDSKTMSNHPVISYTLLLMDNIIRVCKEKNATLLLISGTESHDNGQLSLFYHYLQDPTIDIRIVEDIRFEQIKGMRCLCIPEKYGIKEEVYRSFLFDSGLYDMVFMHGTIKGSVFGADVETINSTHAPVFSLKHFANCMGLIISGHIHTPGCYEQYMYYTGSPLRFRFGEEQTKGFLITLFNPYERRHYTELVPIDSYIFNTISINHLITEDPKKIIEYIKQVKQERGIDYIRVQFSNPGENMNIVYNYFRNNSYVKFDEKNKAEKNQQTIDSAVADRLNEYSYILDNNISDYDKFTMYINQNEGYEFITTEELISLLEEDL